MEGMLVFSLFMALLFGGTMLILVSGYQSVAERLKEAEERAAESVSSSVPLATVAPRFFARLGDEAQPVTLKVDDAFVAQLESFLVAEREAADQFIAEPTIANLYRGYELEQPLTH